MSSVGDERWRTSRAQQSTSDQNQNPIQPRHYNQQRQPGRGSVIPPRVQESGGLGVSAMSGNAWVNTDRVNREAPQQGLTQEGHVPVNGFNAQEARNILKNGFSSETKKVTSYKAPSQAGAKSGSPWGSKPNTMGNGKDFFLELRKQFTTIQQHGPERAGG